MKKIDFEAHFYTKAYLKALAENKNFPKLVEDEKNKSRRLWYAAEVGQPFADPLYDSLLDHGEGRLKRMDAMGVDVQVLSLSAPGLEQLDPEAGTVLAREANNALAGSRATCGAPCAGAARTSGNRRSTSTRYPVSKRSPGAVTSWTSAWPVLRPWRTTRWRR